MLAAADLWVENSFDRGSSLPQKHVIDIRIVGMNCGRLSMFEFERITYDQNVMGGKATIRGMRVTVSLIVNLVANGMSADEISEAYPYLEREDIRQALHFAAWLAEETVHPVELAS